MTRLSNREPGRNTSGGIHRALEFLLRTERLLEEGTPVRIVKKILRKKGIHPWSLIALPTTALDRRLRCLQLGVPERIIRGCEEAWTEFEGTGLTFRDTPPGFRLPEGLVVDTFRLLRGSVRQLPRRLRANFLAVVGTRIQKPRRLACRPHFLALQDCPDLRSVVVGPFPRTMLILQRCPRLKRIQGSRRRARGLSRLRLSELPSLERFPAKGKVGSLQLIHCQLESLHGFTVENHLELHRCQRLRDLPRLEGKVKGHITDCPALSLPEGWTEGLDENFRLEHLRGRCALPPLQPQPHFHPAHEPSLFRGDVLPEDPLWPWPPESHGPRDTSLSESLQAMGLCPLDAVRCQLGPGERMADALMRELVGTRTPGEGLALLGQWLISACHFSAKDSARAASVAPLLDILREVLTRSSLGSVSLWMHLRHHPERPWTAKHDQCLEQFFHGLIPPVDDLEELSDALGSVPGPFVLREDLFTMDFRLGPKAFDGPIWCEGNVTLSNIPELERLPDVMVVLGDLTMEDLPALQAFPRRLHVQGDLRVEGLPRLRRSICRASVEGETRIQAAPGLNLVPPGSLIPELLQSRQ